MSTPAPRHRPGPRPVCAQLKPTAELPLLAQPEHRLGSPVPRPSSSIVHPKLPAVPITTFTWSSHWRIYDCPTLLDTSSITTTFNVLPLLWAWPSSDPLPPTITLRACWAQIIRETWKHLWEKDLVGLHTCPLSCPLQPQNGQSQRHRSEVSDGKMCLLDKDLNFDWKHGAVKTIFQIYLLLSCANSYLPPRQ